MLHQRALGERNQLKYIFLEDELFTRTSAFIGFCRKFHELIEDHYLWYMTSDAECATVLWRISWYILILNIANYIVLDVGSVHRFSYSGVLLHDIRCILRITSSACSVIALFNFDIVQAIRVVGNLETIAGKIIVLRYSSTSV